MKKKILCTGEALIDFIANDSNSNNLINSSTFVKKAGGAPANAAATMTKFNIDAYFLGCLGDDSFGQFLKKEMELFNIKTKYIQFSKTATTLAFVSIDKNGERDFEFFRGADKELNISNFDVFKNFDCFHFASATAFLGGNLEKTYYDLLTFAKNNNIFITFDANYRDSLFSNRKDIFIKHCKYFIKHSDIVKLSEEEAILISDTKNIKDAGNIIKKLGCTYLIITLGKDGSLLFHDNEINKISSTEVKMLDSTGAGDAFIGAVIAQTIQQDNINKSSIIKNIEIASKIAAITTTRLGALSSIPSLDEVI